MANLVELFDNIVQMENLNGVPLAAGKLYVYALGRTRLMDTWSDVDGESLNPNPIILDDAGQAHVYVSDDFDYTLVVCDQYNSEIFSLDKYLYSKGSHSHADVAVAPSESIAVSSYHVGECTVYVPYLTGQLGKVYEGIDPIVVNNQIDKISANHVPLGVQDPLYFVQDDEEGCIIGCSAQTEIPSALSSKWDEASDAVIANSAQWAEGTTYEEGSYVDIDGHTINVTGLQPAGNYQSAGDYVVHDELSSYATEDWVENQSYMKEYMESAFYPATSNPSGYLTAHQDISNKLDTTAFSTVSGDFLTAVPSEYVTENTLQSGLSSKLDSTAFSTVSGNFLTAHQDLSDYAKTEDLTAYQEKGNYYSASNPSGFINSDAISAMATTGFVAGVSGDITALIPTGEYLDKASADTLYYGINNPSGFITGVPADMATTGDIADMAQSISETYQPIGNYQTAGNYYSASNPSGFITGVDLTPYQTTAGMTAYQSAGNYQTAGNYVSATELTAYATTAKLSEVSGEITAMIPTALTGEYVAGNNESGFAITSISGSIAVGENDYLGSQAIGITKSNSGIWLSPNQLEIYGNGVDETINAADISALKQLSSNKLDSTAFSTVSGNFLTAVDLTPYQTTAGMTAYQSAGDYLTTADSANFYTTANESGFITGVDLTPYQLTADMTAYQPVGNYLSSNALDNLSGNWETVTAKLDTTAFSTVSGTFLTAHQDLSDYQTTAGMTAYQPILTLETGSI